MRNNKLMRPTGPISKSEMRPTGPKSSSLDFGLEFGDSEISDLLSAATTCHLWGVAPLSGDKQLVTRPVDWSACPGGGFALPSWHAEMFPGQALNRLSLSRNGSSDHSSHADDEWFSTLSSHSGSPRSQKDVPMSPEFFPPIAPNRDGEARGPGLPMDAGLSWSVLSPSLSAREPLLACAPHTRSHTHNARSHSSALLAQFLAVPVSTAAPLLLCPSPPVLLSPPHVALHCAYSRPHHTYVSLQPRTP